MDLRTSRLRFVVPNAVTSLSVLFGVFAVQAALRGRPMEGAWWALLVTLTDKADGFLATRLDAKSNFGVQLDSLADLVSFGVAPGAVLYGYYRLHPELGWAEGGKLVLLSLLTGLYTIGAALRLARYNVGAEDQLSKGEVARHFSGIPTTMTAALVMSIFLAVLKYSDPSASAPETSDALRLAPGLRLDGLLPLLPWLLPLGAAGMLSSLPVPKLGRTARRSTDVLLAVSVVSGYTLGVARLLPEYLAGGGLFYLAIVVVNSLRGARGR
jgi:CDP-diacylglycerol--serine O-phosphatidyltransferase